MRPCQFCHAEAVVVCETKVFKLGNEELPINRYRVQCPQCGIRTGESISMKRAVDTWDGVSE